MQYLHDVWVNYFEEDNLNLLPFYHEWSKSDNVELMDQIPVLKVNENLFDYIAYGFNRLNDDILNKVQFKTYLRKNNERLLEQYGFICTEDKRVIVTILDASGKVSKRSYLIPRQHQLVLEIMKDKEPNFELENKVDVSHYNTYIGLTRLEKDVLTKTVDFVKELVPEKLSMLKYIVAEWDLGLHKKVLGSSFDEIKSMFLDEILGSDTSRLVEFNTVIDKLVTK